VSAADDPLHGIERATETLESYSGLHSATVCVLYPKSDDQLTQIFAHARSATPCRRLTFRSGGHSFDEQSLGDDLVVSMKHFNTIDPLVEQKQVRVGPGARWGDIVRALQPWGLVPAVTVTTENATAGGTLSGDCLSRFSPAWGKEGKWVASFELLTVDGTPLTCTPPADGAVPSTLGERVFMATIGGLGYLGAVTEITYDLLDVGCSTKGTIGVRTEVQKQKGFDDLAKALVPAVMKAYDEPSDPRDHCKHDAIYSALSGRAKNRQTLLFSSAFTTSLDRHPMLLFRPHFLPRVLVEWGFRWSAFNRLLWALAYRWGYPPWVVYLDDLEGFTFFMDGNVRAKRVARKLFRVNLTTLQQTFVVPAKTETDKNRTDEDWTGMHDKLVKWLERAEAVLDENNLTPTLQDVLFLPRDERFPLSMSAGMAGFAVTYAFETSNRRRLARARDTFEALAKILSDDFKGRVYLVKNVCASPETLRAMYGANADEFFSVKAMVDPDCILRNGFLNKTFGDRLPAT
jgi:decaprenylphospho-beta-D-ribofuranose 2-oxidase